MKEALNYLKPHKEVVTNLFRPNAKIPKVHYTYMVVAQIIIALWVWQSHPGTFLPTPTAILSKLWSLVSDGGVHFDQGHIQVEDHGILIDLLASIKLNLWSIFYTLLLALPLSYLSVMPFFRPLVFIITKLRYLSLMGLVFVFTVMMGGAYELKVSLLTFGMMVFFVTSLLSVIVGIPTKEYNYGRSLRMGEWRIVWETVIMGRLDDVFEILRQNFAMAWMMLTSVEVIARADGGIGIMLSNQSKYLHLDAVFAIQIIIILVGIFQDLLIIKLKKLVCPYSFLIIEKQ